MRKIWSALAVIAALVAAPAAVAQPEIHNTDEEVVVVHVHRDRGMDAFLRGDFATAEVEFKKNFRCYRRVEMLRYAALESLLWGSVTQLNLGATAPVIYAQNQETIEEPQTTCEARDWQLYMIAMSQIQQGNIIDARYNLDRVTQLGHDPYLFDAYFRLGLIDILQGDTRRANTQLTRLNRVLRGCRNRSVGCEYIAEVEASVDYLRSAIRQAEQGTSLN